MGEQESLSEKPCSSVTKSEQNAANPSGSHLEQGEQLSGVASSLNDIEQRAPPNVMSPESKVKSENSLPVLNSSNTLTVAGFDQSEDKNNLLEHTNGPSQARQERALRKSPEPQSGAESLSNRLAPEQLLKNTTGTFSKPPECLTETKSPSKIENKTTSSPLKPFTILSEEAPRVLPDVAKVTHGKDNTLPADSHSSFAVRVDVGEIAQKNVAVKETEDRLYPVEPSGPFQDAAHLERISEKDHFSASDGMLSKDEHMKEMSHGRLNNGSDHVESLASGKSKETAVKHDQKNGPKGKQADCLPTKPSTTNEQLDIDNLDHIRERKEILRSVEQGIGTLNSRNNGSIEQIAHKKTQTSSEEPRAPQLLRKEGLENSSNVQMAGESAEANIKDPPSPKPVDKFTDDLLVKEGLESSVNVQVAGEDAEASIKEPQSSNSAGTAKDDLLAKNGLGQEEPCSGSSSAQSDSSESSSSTLDSNSSSPSSSEHVNRIRALMMKEEEQATDKVLLRTKNERDENDIEIKKPTYEVTDAHTLRTLGKISGVMEKTVIIMTNAAERAKASGMPCVGTEQDIAEAIALDSGSVVCFSDRTILGEIFETFGQVTSPYYIVRFNNHEEIAEVDAKVGREVFYISQLSKTVRAKDVHIKGYDSSNFYDEEVKNQADFSDDEAEAEARRSRKRARQANTSNSMQGKPMQRAATAPKRPFPRRRNHNESQGWKARSQSAWNPGNGNEAFQRSHGPRAPQVNINMGVPAAQNHMLPLGSSEHATWVNQFGMGSGNRMANSNYAINGQGEGYASNALRSAYTTNTPSVPPHHQGVRWVDGSQRYNSPPNSSVASYGPYPGVEGLPFPFPNAFPSYNQVPTQGRGTPTPQSMHVPPWVGAGNMHAPANPQAHPLPYYSGASSQMYRQPSSSYSQDTFNYPQPFRTAQGNPPNFPTSSGGFPQPPPNQN